MDWNETQAGIIDYVERQLQSREEEIDFRKIEKLAGCSYPFFQKVFSYMNGIGFSEYIRFRKLTLAGYDLKSTDCKVIDLSVRYGYDSPTSFTKAFARFHGVSPKEARRTGAPLRAYPRLQAEPPRRCRWRLTHRPSMRLIGVSARIPCGDGRQAAAIPAFWSDCQANGVFARLTALSSAANPDHEGGLFGVFESPGEPADALTYSVMTRSDARLPEGFRELMLPEADWAEFDCVGPVPEAIQKGWKYLTEEWLVKYPFRHACCPELEWYGSGSSYGRDYLSRIWIPVILE